MIARASGCEWCARAFGGKVIASVHHIVTDYRTDSGEPDWDAYLAMRDEDVVVICKGCHFFWHDRGLKPGDPPLTCRCGKWKEPQFETCRSCLGR